MTDVMAKHLAYRKLRAPERSGTALVEPPFASVPDLVAENRRRQAGWCYDLQGRCLSEVARQARDELLAAARQWTAAYRDLEEAAADGSGPVLLAGHQPELFHPGVWFKNLALSRLAGQLGGVAVNLLVDTDSVKGTSIPVPGGTPHRPHVAALPLDRPGPAMAYEERPVLDRDLFGRFGQRAAAEIEPLVPDPLIGRYWPLVLDRLEETPNLGACLAQARHGLEGRWGFRTLEVPESWVCRSESFAWLAVHLLAHLPRFWAAYNEALGAYRREHGIRGRARPAPDLGREGEWREAPFWIWSADDPRRRRLFARAAGGQVVLSDRRDREIRLDLTPDGTGGRAVAELQQLERRQIKIRPRALITTLWARIALGDLFLHGIGGAKYDQVTDALMARFFGFDPPQFLVLSATLHLPVPRPGVTIEDLRRIDFRLRELDWHPELYVDGGDRAGSAPPVSELIAQKRRWIATEPTPETARSRFLAIRRINAALQPWVADQRERLLAERAQTLAALEADRTLACRTYAFCLFPERTLQEGFSQILPSEA